MADDENVDVLLSLLEARIRDLKFDYDRYFNKDIKREPVRKREDVERLIVKLSKSNFIKASQKFSYENIISRFISLKTFWDKRLRQLETMVKKAEETAEPDRQPLSPSYRQVYTEYVDLVTALNPSAKISSYETIQQTLDSKRGELLRQYKCKDIEFKVEYEGKKLKFKAIPKF